MHDLPMITTDWPRILLEVGIHYALIHLLIVFARKTRWLLFAMLAVIVAGFVLLIFLTIPPATPADLVQVDGTYKDYTVDAGNLLLHLQNDSRVFGIYDMEYFQKEQFLQEVQNGAPIRLAVLRKYQHNLSRPVVVFEVSVQGKIYMPMEPLFKERQRDRYVTLPIMLICSVLVAIGSIVAAFSHREVYDTIVGSYMGTLLMLVLDFYFPKTGLSSLIPSMALLLIYPSLLLIENRFREFDRTTWTIASINYVMMIAFAGVTLWLVLSR